MHLTQFLKTEVSHLKKYLKDSRDGKNKNNPSQEHNQNPKSTEGDRAGTGLETHESVCNQRGNPSD